MEIYLRFVDENDTKHLYDWRNDPTIRKFARNTEDFSFESHLDWFRKSIADPKRNIFMAIDEKGSRVGQVRFDREGEMAEIDIAVSPGNRGKGFGTKLLKKSCENYLNNWDVNYLFAEVKRENIASVKIFEKAGFKIHEDEKEKIRVRFYR